PAPSARAAPPPLPAALPSSDLVRARADRHGELEDFGRAAAAAALADPAGRGAHAVDRDLDLVRLARGALHLDVERVFGIEREVALHAQSAARAERQPVDGLVLRQLER